MTQQPIWSNTSQFADPFDVARRTLAAFEAHDWPQVIDAIAPNELDWFQRKHVHHATLWQNGPSDHPPQSEFARQVAERGNPVLFDFIGVASLEELSGLSPAECFLAYLKHNDLKAAPESGWSPAETRRTVIGIAYEDVNTAHVVYRRETRAEYVHAVEMEVVSARQAHDGWRLLLNRDLCESNVMRSLP